MLRPPSQPPPLVVFAEDWGRHNSACQHLIRELAHRYPVLWVNTIGMRRPSLGWATLARGWQKAWDWSFAQPVPASGPPLLRVLNPVMWPWMRSRLDRWLNRQLLTRQVRRAIRRWRSPPIFVTKVPIMADLLDTFPGSPWVYYCVDDFTAWPGVDQAAVLAQEQKLIRRADRLITVSDVLRDRLMAMGRCADLLTHGVDVAAWRFPDAPPAPELDGLPRPLILTWGLIDRRLDVPFLRALSAGLTQGTIALVGPAQGPDPDLFRIPRVVTVPPVPVGRLPALAQHASVLVMPYADLPVTRAMQPLKLKELLATARPVVARDLPSSRAWGDALDLVRTPDEFRDAVLLRLRTGLPADQALARRRLDGESWRCKAAHFEESLLAAWSGERSPVAASAHP